MLGIKDELELLCLRSSKIIFFTGAGISTDSGIPDYRSPGTGLWNKIKPVEFRKFIEDKGVREDYWEARFISSSPLDIASPNPSHFAISDIIHSGKGLAVITQNVDNLHQRSGIPEELVIELHGNASYAKCLSCETRIELVDLRKRWSRKVEVSRCSLCGGIVKAATISFGQEMPRLPMAQSAGLIQSCDLMIVVGSSLLVHPAAVFPQYAKQLGAALVILNNEPTPLDDLADILVRERIGDVFPELSKKLILA